MAEDAGSLVSGIFVFVVSMVVLTIVVFAVSGRDVGPIVEITTDLAIPFVIILIVIFFLALVSKEV